MSDSESDNVKSDSDEELNDGNVISEEERLKIREKISNLSFEDLLSMKEEMGSKLYNQSVFGVTNKKKKVSNFTRANKNRPREISSKIRTNKLKKILNPNTNVVTVTKKAVPRDPRFDPLCGEFDDKAFKSNYNFINDLRHDERKQLVKELESCEDPKRKNTIKLLIQRLDNQIREKEKRQKEESKNIEERKEIRDKLKKGEKPVFKKKSVKKLESLIEKYEELKKTNRLQKHIEKRSKKLMVKERKKLER